MIDTDSETYRVEQFYPGKPFEYSDLRDKEVLEQCTRLICDFNYDEQLLEIRRSALTSDKFMGD